MVQMAQTDVRRSRVRMDGEAIIRGPEGDWRAPLEDLSVTGLHMPRPAGHGLALGQAVEVELVAGPPEAEIDFLLMARVARIDATTIGLRFAPMPGPMARTLERVLSHYGTLRTGTHDDRVVRP